MSASQNPDAMTSTQGEFRSRVAPSEPLTTKGVRPRWPLVEETRDPILTRSRRAPIARARCQSRKGRRSRVPRRGIPSRNCARQIHSSAEPRSGRYGWRPAHLSRGVTVRPHLTADLQRNRSRQADRGPVECRATRAAQEGKVRPRRGRSQ